MVRFLGTIYRTLNPTSKNLLKNDVRFSRFLHDLWYDSRYDTTPSPSITTQAPPAAACRRRGTGRAAAPGQAEGRSEEHGRQDEREAVVHLPDFIAGCSFWRIAGNKHGAGPPADCV